MMNPKIRFKQEDGSDFPAWTIGEIESIAHLQGGGTPSTTNADYWGGNIQWLTPTEINSKYVHESKRTLTEAGLNNSNAKLLPTGAILLTTRATIGACSINNFDGLICTNQGFQSLICKPSLYNEYAYYAITHKKFKKKLIQHASGSTFLEISSKNLKKLAIPLPCLDEQQKIASFFSILDHKIELNERKLEALKILKKGLIHKIFNQDIRFKKEDGSDFSEWRSNRIESIVSYERPDRYIIKTIIKSKGKVPVLTANKAFVLGYSDEEDSETYNKGNVIIFDDFTCDMKFVNFPFKVKSSAIKLLTTNEKQCSLKFAFEAIKNLNIQPQGHKRHWISFVQKQNLSIPSLEEQQKIASFLSALDHKIELNKRKIEALKKLKQGFMQQMFV